LNNPNGDKLHRAIKILFTLSLPVRELYHGLRTRTIPAACTGSAVVMLLFLVFHVDHLLLSKTRFKELYPYYPFAYRAYYFALITIGYWVWAWREAFFKLRLTQRLKELFQNAGLVSRTGRLPNFISDFSLDGVTRKLRLTHAGFPKIKFEEAKAQLEAGLQVYIDDIKEKRETGVIEIFYSHIPMPEEVHYMPKEAAKSYDFLVGATRSEEKRADLRKVPHLLIAGQTGGGKSTFLRQLIIHLYLNNSSCQFLLIDLKGGLEFCLFENRKRIAVVPHVRAAMAELKKVDNLLERRFTLLRENKCKDIDAYLRLGEKNGSKVNLDRHVLVIDEAAEMFLAGHHAKSEEIQNARRVLSRVARQGRAVGIHLVVATQRPDSKSLDPQVKANLTGVICFQMMNDASSIAVLGNGRATDLPAIPGRAIWKSGIEMTEVQTPFLSTERAEELLGEPEGDGAPNSGAKSALTLLPTIALEVDTQPDEVET
jgi:hypothetical protein